MPLVFMVEDGISSEELNQFLQQNPLGSSKKRKLNNAQSKYESKKARNISCASSSSPVLLGDSQYADEALCPNIVPSDVRSGILKRIQAHGSLDNDSDDDSGVGCRAKGRHKGKRIRTYSRDLKDMLKEKDKVDRDSSNTDTPIDSYSSPSHDRNKEYSKDTSTSSSTDVCACSNFTSCTRNGLSGRYSKSSESGQSCCRLAVNEESSASFLNCHGEDQQDSSSHNSSSVRKRKKAQRKYTKLSEKDETTSTATPEKFSKSSFDNVGTNSNCNQASNGLDSISQAGDACKKNSKTNFEGQPNKTLKNDEQNSTAENSFISKIDVSVLTSPQSEQKNDEYFTLLSQSIPEDLYVALDCEFVGVGDKGRKSVLGRCSILDYEGRVLYDNFVRPSELITDFRTPWSGIRPHHMKNAIPLNKALTDIGDMLKNKIVIGHAVYNDFKVLNIKVAHHQVRDTAQCKLLTEMSGLAARTNGLKKLASAVLGRQIQVGKKGHCSVEDSLASLDLFKFIRSQWEPQLLKLWDRKGVDMEKYLREMSNKHVEEDFLGDRFWS